MLLPMNAYSVIVADTRVAVLFQHGYQYQERFWNNIRQLKCGPIIEEAELLEANLCYVYIRLQNNKETMVALRDLAPCWSCAKIFF